MLYEGLHHVNRHRENDGGVLLRCDGVEGLEVAQLQSRWGLSDHQRCLLQCPWRIHFPLSGYHLQTAEGRCEKKHACLDLANLLHHTKLPPLNPVSIWRPLFPLQSYFEISHRSLVHLNMKIFWKCTHPASGTPRCRWVCFFIGRDLEKFCIVLLAHQYILWTECMPSNWEIKELIKTSQ